LDFYNAAFPRSENTAPHMSVPNRILHLISRLDGYGGARTLRLVAAKQAALGNAVAIAALGAEHPVVQELRLAGVEVDVAPRRWRFDPLALGRLAHWRRERPGSLVHAWDIDALLHAWLTNRREQIVAAWDAHPQTPPWVARLTGVRSTLIPPALAARELSGVDRQAALNDLGLEEKVRWIAIAGSLDRRKELDEAIWCYELVRVLHPTARLVIFGDGPDRHRLERYASLVSEPGCVRFAGFRADLADLLPHVDAYWQLDPASRTSHALLEALAAGAPVVASDVSAHRVAITHEATGMLVPLRSRADVARATDQLLNDADFALRLGQAAAEAATKSWSIDKTLAACEAIYHSWPPAAP
jgi:glycosyltransferase involved in cell wall biosynthesis